VHSEVSVLLYLFLAAACATLGTAAENPSTQSLWGRPVAEIRLECDTNLSLADFSSQVTQKVGEPLASSAVAESLRNLFATGRFAELRADVRLRGKAVELIFVGRAQLFLGTVSVEGAPHGIDPHVLANSSRLRLGQALTPEALALAEQRLITTLGMDGYYLAEVHARLHRHPHNQQADVTLAIAAGQPARLREIEFEGRSLIPPPRLAKIAGWRVGRHLTAARLERGISRVRRFFTKRGYLQAMVTVRARVFEPATNTERLTVTVESGPRIQVRVKGARVSSTRLRELLPVFSEGLTDEQAVALGQRNLEDYFERQGYLAPSVLAQTAASADGERLDITYTVNLGERRNRTTYRFVGNSELSENELATALGLDREGNVFTRQPFSHRLLAEDVRLLAMLYQTRGFASPSIKPTTEVREQGGHLLVTLEIQEGPRTTVGKLELRGVDAGAAQDVMALMATKPPGPFSPLLADRDREAIQRYFVDRGYPQVTVSWQASPVSSSDQVSLQYQIALGRKETIRQVLVGGNKHTRAGIVRRELTLRAGDSLSQSQLLESQRRLYSLGVFNQVQIASQNPEGTETARTVLVNVEEAPRWTVGYGGGLEVQRLGSNDPQGQFKASPRVSLDITRLNVGGRAQTLTLRGRFSNLQTGGALSYLIPHFPTRPDLTLRLNFLIDRSRDVLTFTADRREASVTVEKHYSPRALLIGRYSFRRVRALDISDRIRPEQIPLLSRAARIAALSVSYINDHRDDPTDATEGSYSLADAGISWRLLGSEASFVRVAAQNSTYYRLRPHLIFARNTRFGVETPFGGPRKVVISEGSQAGQVVEARDIPLPERFFMGGSESHRGFSINQAGPRDAVTGFPIGGNAFFLNSLELRVPFMENRLGVTLFHDGGNVFSSIRRMRLLKVTQKSPATFDYAVHAVGLGLRYKTPVGPLRLDFGYNLNPPRFYVGQEVRRLSPLQLFFSIGQSF